MADITTFITTHPGLIATIAAFVVGLLDLVFALKPDWASNGLLHWLLLQAQTLAKKQDDVPKV